MDLYLSRYSGWIIVSFVTEIKSMQCSQTPTAVLDAGDIAVHPERIPENTGCTVFTTRIDTRTILIPVIEVGVIFGDPGDPTTLGGLPRVPIKVTTTGGGNTPLAKTAVVTPALRQFFGSSYTLSPLMQGTYRISVCNIHHRVTILNSVHDVQLQAWNYTSAMKPPGLQKVHLFLRALADDVGIHFIHTADASQLAYQENMQQGAEASLEIFCLCSTPSGTGYSPFSPNPNKVLNSEEKAKRMVKSSVSATLRYVVSRKVLPNALLETIADFMDPIQSWNLCTDEVFLLEPADEPSPSLTLPHVDVSRWSCCENCSRAIVAWKCAASQMN